MNPQKLDDKYDLAQATSYLAVAVNSGLSALAAMELYVRVSNGNTAKHFERLLKALQLGGNVFEEFETLRRKSKNEVFNQLLVKIEVSLQLGTPLADQLEQLAESILATIWQEQLTIASKRENLMLMPLVFLILPASVLVTLYPSMQYLQLIN